MFFGDEHLGRAVAFLRENHNLEQQELAARLGIKPGTLSQYESGRRGMGEDLLKRIAQALGLALIEIWDTAYRIFRYNFLREQAKEEGIPVEDLIARFHTGPSVEQVMELHDSWAERDRQVKELTLRLLDSRSRSGLDGFNLLKVLVEPRPQKTPRKKAVRFAADRGKASTGAS